MIDYVIEAILNLGYSRSKRKGIKTIRDLVNEKFKDKIVAEVIDKDTLKIIDVEYGYETHIANIKVSKSQSVLVKSIDNPDARTIEPPLIQQ